MYYKCFETLKLLAQNLFMLIEDYLDLIQETESESEDVIEYERQLAVVENRINNPGQYPELPEDIDLHPEFYHGELVDYHGQ